MTADEHPTLFPAVYVILRKDDAVLLLRRANTGFRDGFYCFPAGRLNGQESAIQAAIRETKEEVGISVDKSDLRMVHVTHRLAEEGDHERIDFFFEATKWQGKPYNAEPKKCDDVAWFPLHDLPKNMVPLAAEALKKIAAGQVYSDSNFS